MVISTMCPFCKFPDSECVQTTAVGRAFRDQYPLSQGHTLVTPRNHVASLFDLNTVEQADLWKLVASVREQLQREFNPDGFNIGLNDGTAAGQTVMHAHIHVIPRYAGDVPDPRGGVRWIIQEKADYWSKPK